MRCTPYLIGDSAYPVSQLLAKEFQNPECGGHK
jgi:hypothetical protein